MILICFQIKFVLSHSHYDAYLFISGMYLNLSVYKHDLYARRPSEKEILSLNYSPKVINLKSTFKLLGIFAICGTLSYASVVPRNAPIEDYNHMFKETSLRLFLSGIWPSFLMWLVYGAAHVDVNEMLDSFVHSMFFLYPLICLYEFFIAVVVRVCILRIFDAEAFELNPKVPGIVLPWTLAANGYLPRRVTMYLFSFINGCLMSPMMEELYKVRMLRNMILRSEAAKERDCMRGATTVRTYVIHMLAISLGLKTADNIRRILLYNAPKDRYKSFFAIFRSIFPVQELCGVLSALSLAQSTLLENNDNLSINALFRILNPALLLHFMANFRGTKPFFVWSSKMPWNEIQIQALGAPDGASAGKLFFKCAFNLMWFTVLFRTFSHAVQKYVHISRQFYEKTATNTRNKQVTSK